MSVVLDVTIPGIPPINSAGHHGGNHWSRTQIKRQWESKICVAVLDALGRWPEAPLDRAEVTLIRRSASEPDFDNLVGAQKFILDGLVKAGVIADDSPKVIGRPDVRWEFAPRGQSETRIVVFDPKATMHQTAQDDSGATIDCRVDSGG